MSETGYTEDCCFNEIRDHCPIKRSPCSCRCHTDYPLQPAAPIPDWTGGDLMSLVDAEMSRLKALLRVTERERDSARQALAAIVADLRQTAEAYHKSAAVAPKRIERKHLTEIAVVLTERADYYERRAGGE